MGKTLFADIPGNRFSVALEAAASGATNTAQSIGYFVAPANIKLEQVLGAFEAAWTGQATNFQTTSVVNLGTSGAGTTAMASLAWSSTDIAVGSGAVKEIPLSSTPANLLASSGEVIIYKIAAASSGQAYPKHHVTLEFSYQ